MTMRRALSAAMILAVSLMASLAITSEEAAGGLAASIVAGLLISGNLVYVYVIAPKLMSAAYSRLLRQMLAIGWRPQNGVLSTIGGKALSMDGICLCKSWSYERHTAGDLSSSGIF